MISSPAHTIQPTEHPQKTVHLAETQDSIAKTPITPVLEGALAMTRTAEVVVVVAAASSAVIQEATPAAVSAEEIPVVAATRAVAVAISNVLLA